MDYILENVFSTWLFGIIPLLLLFWISTKIGKVAARKENFNTIYRWVALFLVPVGAIVFCGFNELDWGYGYVKKIKGSANNQKWLCFVSESNFHMGSRGGHGSHYNARLYVLDPKTGERIYRDVIGEFSELIELRGDTLFYKAANGAFVVRNVNTRKNIAMIDYELVPGIFTELAAGVSSCAYSKYSGNIKITALTGKIYYLDPFTMKLSTEDSNSGQGGHVNDDDVRAVAYDLKINEESTVVLNRKDNSMLFEIAIEKKSTKKEKEKVIANDLIEAKILGHSWPLKRFLVESYETTKKDNFIISCFSYEGELLWQLKQNTLVADDFYTEGNSQGTGRYYGYTSTMDIHQVVGENLVFSIQGFVFSVSINTGKVNWQARL